MKVAEKRRRKTLADIKAEKMEKIKALKKEIKALEKEEEQKKFDEVMRDFKKLRIAQQEEIHQLILNTLKKNKKQSS